MNGICLMWSKGRLISPSLPVDDDRYLNLSSQKRPTGRNLGVNRSVRLSGTTSRDTVENELHDYITAFTSFPRASFLTCRQISHLVG